MPNLGPPQWATVHLDGHGIPHIESPSLPAALYALGRQHMQDFPVRVPYNIWASTGRLSAIAGPGIDDQFVEQDFDALRWRFPEAALRHFGAMQNGQNPFGQSQVLPLLCAYVRGLNDGRLDVCQELGCGLSTSPELNTAPLRLDPTTLRALLSEPIHPVDVLAFAQRVTSVFPLDTLRTIIQTNGSAVPPCSTLSNAWMVSAAARELPGLAPILASDPHLPPEEITLRASFGALHAPGISASGWWIPGLPAPAMGTNGTVAWAATGTAVASVGAWRISLPSLTLSPPASSSTGLLAAGTFQVGGIPRSIYGEQLRIDVRDLQTNTLATRSRVQYWADPLGLGPQRQFPVVSAQGSGKLLFVEAAFVTNETSFFEFLTRLLLASNMAAVDAAVATNVMFDQNFLAASGSGDLRYWQAGRRPIRSAGSPNPFSILDGSVPAQLWNPNLIHPASAIPQEIRSTSSPNTAEVWINNNVDPALTRAPSNSTIAPGIYPEHVYASCTQEANLRQLRARDLLSNSISNAQSRAALMDIRDNWATTQLPYFAYAYLDLLQLGFVDPARAPEVAAWIIPLLDGTWNGEARSDGSTTSVYAARAFLLRSTFETYALHIRETLGVPLPQLLGELREPGLLPTLTQWQSESLTNPSGTAYAADLILMGVALECAALEVTGSAGANNASALPANRDPSTWQVQPLSWTPLPACLPHTALPFLPGSDPLSGLPTLALSQLRCLELSATTATIFQTWRYPLDGVNDSLFSGPIASETLRIKEGPSFTANGQGTSQCQGLRNTTTLLPSGSWFPARFNAYSPHTRGSRSLIHIELTTPPTVHYAAALGSTERTNFTRRYAPSSCFAARQWTRLPTNPNPLPTIAQWLY